MGTSTLEREAVNERRLRQSDDSRYRAESLIDIAMWDLAAKAADLPLGGARDRMPVYASTPVFDAVDDLKARGYQAAKLHTRCDPDWDLEDGIGRRYGPRRGMRFILDVAQPYTLNDAIRVDTVLAKYDYLWFEAPLPDRNLEDYASLCRAVDVPVIAAGNTLTRRDKLHTGPTISVGSGRHARPWRSPKATT